MDFSFVSDSLRPLVRAAYSSLQSAPGLAALGSLDDDALAELCLDDDGTNTPDTEQAVLRCARALGCANTREAIRQSKRHLYQIYRTHYLFANKSNAQRTFNAHFLPLVEAFGLRTLRRPDPSDETLSSFKTFLQKKRRSKFVLTFHASVLAQADADPAYVRILRETVVLDADQVNALWKRCRPLCTIVHYLDNTGKRSFKYMEPYTSTKVTKTTIRDRSETLAVLLARTHADGGGALDGGAVPLEDAVAFCTGRGRLIGARILILAATGYPRVDLLVARMAARDAQLASYAAFHHDADALNNAFEYRIGCYDALLQVLEIDHLADVAGLGLPRLTEGMECSEQPRNHLRIVESVLAGCGRSGDYGHLERSFDWKHTHKKNSERWNERGEWHRELLTLVMRNHEGRIRQKSAYVAEHTQLMESRTASMLMFLSEHVARLDSSGGGGGSTLRWFLGVCTFAMVRDAVLAYAESTSVSNSRVKSSHSSHHAKRPASAMITMFKKGFRDTIPCHKELGTLTPNSITENIEDRRIQADPSRRRTYTDEEIELLLAQAAAARSPQDVLLVTLLREIGLRAGAVGHLRYYDIIDTFHRPKHLCRVMEKGRQIREFVTGPNLKRVIAAYIRWVGARKLDADRLYVFARSGHPYKPIVGGSLQQVLTRYANAAGITQVRVHPHAFRHTIVGKLMDAGNKLEVVSKFMGHKSVQTTSQHYWLADIEKLCETMNNPFMETSHRDATESKELEYGCLALRPRAQSDIPNDEYAGI